MIYYRIGYLMMKKGRDILYPVIIIIKVDNFNHVYKCNQPQHPL